MKPIAAHLTKIVSHNVDSDFVDEFIVATIEDNQKDYPVIHDLQVIRSSERLDRMLVLIVLAKTLGF